MPLAIPPVTLHSGVVGLHYMDQIQASGGVAPYDFSATGVPPGLALDSEGIISGAPIESGSFALQVTVTDSAGNQSEGTVVLKVPTEMPADCVDRTCDHVTKDGETVNIAASSVVLVTRNAEEEVEELTISSSSPPFPGQIIVVPAFTELPSGLIALVAFSKQLTGDETLLTLEKASLGDAFADGVVQVVGKESSFSGEASAFGQRSHMPRGTYRGVPPSATGLTSLSCGGGVSSKLHGLSVNPSLSPSMAAIWHHPLFGGSGFYPGTGGLELFQFDLDGSIEVVLGASVSAAATCTLQLPPLVEAIPAGDLGAILVETAPRITLKTSGKVDVQTSVILSCGAEYRWDNGVEYRGSYCGHRSEPLQLTSDSGVDATAMGAIETTVSLDDIVGVDGTISAGLHAGFHPAATPVAEVDASAEYDLGACLACFWKGAPTRVTIVHGVLFKKTLASYGATPPPVSTEEGGESGEEEPSEEGGSAEGGRALMDNALEVSVQQSIPCALLSDGQVACWGAGYEPSLPAIVPGIHNAVQVAAGASFACARLASGHIDCWGDNHFGEHGDGSSAEEQFESCWFFCEPTEVSGISNATDLDAGWGTACAVLAGGSVKCWGDNPYGQLGDGTNTGPERCDSPGWDEPCSRIPVTVENLSGAASVSVNEWDACASLANGGVKCWGEDGYYQLGSTLVFEQCEYVDSPRACSTKALTVSGISGAKEVSGGFGFNCALLTTGTVKCWGGDNQAGQLGNGGTSANPLGEPENVEGLTGAISIGSGTYHTCAVLGSHQVRCWGLNNKGQLGDNLASGWASALPVHVVGLTDAAGIAAGDSVSCAVRVGGGADCWGDSDYGELGIGWEAEVGLPQCTVYVRCSPVPDPVSAPIAAP